MSVLDRYVFRAWIGAWVVSTAALLGLFLLADLVSRLDRFFEAENVNRLALLGRYYVARLPVFFVKIAPMVSLCATMLVLTRFARSNEILPVLVSGRSIRRFLAPAFAGVLLVSGGMFLVDEKIAPALQDQFRETERQLKGDEETENVMVTDSQGQDWFGETFHSRSATMDRVLIVRMNGDFRRVSDIRAKRAEYRRSQRGWLLTEGEETLYDLETQKRTETRALPADGLLFSSSLRPADIEESNPIYRISTLRQLEKGIERYPFEPFWRVQWHSKWTTPLSNLVLVLIGVPLILRSGSRNVFVGVGIALGLGVTFFLVLLAFLDAGNTGKMDPIVSAWFPVILFGALGVALMDSMAT
ncbi:MAG: YjgP/YjgQ family permease [Candidatus Brocadiae bacterium]|nr:YjgP/YjgQ family permease [Candidatus Brocadiia bacterium]